MNRNIIIVLGGAILAAVLVAMLVQVTLGGKKTAKPSGEMTQILVAAADLKVGHELAEGDMRWQEWPEETLFSGAIEREGEQKPEEALTGRLARAVSKDEPVMKNVILRETKGNFVAASLKDGERAMAIEVEASTMVAGFVSPGDFVDVIMTYETEAKLNKGENDPRVAMMLDQTIDELATETVLENVRVLAVDQAAERNEDEDKIKVGKTVTLAVTPEQAERLALADKMGTVVLALRGVGDTALRPEKRAATTDMRMIGLNDEIYEAYFELKKKKGVQETPIRIYQGETLKVAPVK